VAVSTVPLNSFLTQPPLSNKRETAEVTAGTPSLTPACSLYIGIVQEPVRKWEKPWRHQRAIVLFANSSGETRLRIYAEDRIKVGEHVLQIIRVGAK
jgi:hypothetical protein